MKNLKKAVKKGVQSRERKAGRTREYGDVRPRARWKPKRKEIRAILPSKRSKDPQEKEGLIHYPPDGKKNQGGWENGGGPH